MIIRQKMLGNARIVFVAMSFLICVVMGSEVSAITIPEVRIDANSCVYSSVKSAYISGTVTPAAGQQVQLYSKNQKKLLFSADINRDNGGRFNLKVPEGTIRGNKTVTLYIKSTAVPGVGASRLIPVTIGYSASSNPSGGGGSVSSTKSAANNSGSAAAKKQNSATGKKAAAKATAKSFKIVYYGNGGTFGKKQSSFTVSAKTGSVTTVAANKFSRNGYEFVGWATNTSRGWLVGGMKNMKTRGKVSLKNFQLGNVAFRAKARVNANKLYSIRKGNTVQLHAVWKGKGPQAAVDWACIHAADNRFTYGKQSGLWHGKRNRRQHCHGCYYCGTNRRKWNGGYRYKEAKAGSRWDRTWCCNPFISAAYTHGANHGSRCFLGNMDYYSWTSESNGHGKFRKMGMISSSKLRVGDIFFNNYHVWMYAGNGCRVESAYSGWGADTIRVRGGVGRGSARGIIRYVPR